ncbi:MAG: tetratricopeptide repeat protein, partial [bacterium]
IGLANGHNQNDFDELILKGKNVIFEGVQKWDEKVLIQARALFERLLQKDKMPWLTHYYMGYADYRLSLYYQSKNNQSLSTKYLDEGIEHLRESIKSKDDFAESHALLSNLLGQKIGTDPALGMTLGPESGFELQRAKQLDEKNPRVLFISAMSAYFTPPEFGGSQTRAVEQMKAAIDLFKKEKIEDPRLPDWGHTEALTWLAKFYMQEKKWELAKQNLEKALKIDPQNQFAKMVQSQLEQKRAQE